MNVNRAMASATGLVLLALVGAGCASDAPAARAVVRDSAGVTIVENEWVDSSAAPWWAIEPAPAVDIGTVEGSEEETLFQVRGAVRLSDGRIVIANGGTSEVRYYDSTGEHLRTSGRQGGGPGEFQLLSALVPLAGDSVLAVDFRGRRIHVIDPGGEFARDLPAGGPESSAQVIGRAPDGTWVANSNVFPGGVDDLTNGLNRRETQYIRLAADGSAVADTIGRFAGSETFMQVEQSSGRIVSISILNNLPFRKTTTVILHGDRLYVGTQDAPEIRVHGLDGGLKRIIRTGAPMPPVTPDLINRWVERRVAAAPPERSDALRQSSLELPAGEIVPPYGTFLVDRTGRLWVQDYPDLAASAPWTVYDVEGSRVGRIVLPPEFRPYDIGEDWILGRETDELEVEHVRLYRFAPIG